MLLRIVDLPAIFGPAHPRVQLGTGNLVASQTQAIAAIMMPTQAVMSQSGSHGL